MVKKQKNTTQDHLQLIAEKRTVLGKRVKQLRLKGLVPANIFGPGTPSQSISVTVKDFVKTYKTAKATGVVYVKVEGKETPCLITSLQRHPISHLILHVDFRKIDLTKKITTDVPVHFVDTSAAVVQLGGVLITQTDALSVEALPQDIPSEIVVSLTPLKEIGNEIKVKDIAVNTAYQIKTDPEKVVVSVTAHKEESIIAETAAATPEVLTEKPDAETAAGTEGVKPESTPKEEKKPEGKK